MTETILLPYQKTWVADDSDVRIAEKSRQVGWSWTCACESALDASRRNGRDTWYTGYNKDMAQEFILDTAFWAKHFNAACEDIEEEVFEDEDRSILMFVIRFASGKRVTALSSRPSNLRGKKRSRIIIDEAAHHENLKELIKSAMANLMWGGKIDIISTHNGVDNEFNTLIEGTRSGRLGYSLHRVTFDEALEQGLYKRICGSLGETWSQEKENEWRDQIIAKYGDGADEELFCIPSRSGGTYINRSLIERCMYQAPVLRLKLKDEFATLSDEIRTAEVLDWCKDKLLPLLESLPKDLRHFVGQDFGRTSDLSVIAPVTEQQDLVRKCPFLVELRNVPFREQETILFYLIDRLPRFAKGVIDSTGNGQYLGERAVQQYGEKTIEAVHMTQKWYIENLPRFRSHIEDDLWQIPRDADVMHDLTQFQTIDGIPKLPKAKTRSIGDRTPRHGDAGIALLCADAASSSEIAVYAYEPVKMSDPRMRDARPIRTTRGLRGSKGLW